VGCQSSMSTSVMSSSGFGLVGFVRQLGCRGSHIELAVTTSAIRRVRYSAEEGLFAPTCVDGGV